MTLVPTNSEPTSNMNKPTYAQAMEQRERRLYKENKRQFLLSRLASLASESRELSGDSAITIAHLMQATLAELRAVTDWLFACD